MKQALSLAIMIFELRILDHHILLISGVSNINRGHLGEIPLIVGYCAVC